MDYAQVKVGKDKGKFPTLSDAYLVRADAPIRCTVQRYYLTDRSVVDENEMKILANDIAKLYTGAVATGSLVFSDSQRKTESVQPFTSRSVPAGSTPMASFL